MSKTDAFITLPGSYLNNYEMVLELIFECVLLHVNATEGKCYFILLACHPLSHALHSFLMVRRIHNYGIAYGDDNLGTTWSS